MILRDNLEYLNTRRKLELLTAAYEEAQADAGEDAHVRELEMESFKRLIKQLKEELARYEMHRPPRGGH